MRTMLFAVVALAASACTVEMDDDAVSSTDQHVETHNRLATNRLATNRLATNRLATNRLATNSLGKLFALADTAEILETWEGRDVYSYLVGCALGPEAVLHADVPDGESPPDALGNTTFGPANDGNGNYQCVDGHCTFNGSIGLAPAWQDHHLSGPGKGWVSACMFARVNEHSISVSLSMRGRNDALAITSEEASLYQNEEGAFYGDLFIDNPDPSVPPDWYACSGAGVAADPDSGGLAQRDCAEPNGSTGFTKCGFKYAGPCGDFTPDFASPYACRTSTVEGYGDCHEDSGNKAGSWGGGNKKFRQVITTFVSQ
jgi:hypothetical protein